MKDHLLDIVKHTYALGIELVKITGTDSDTILEAITEDRSVIVKAKFKDVIPEFIGQFGMPNIGKLNIILGIPEYREDAKLTIVTKNNNGVVSPIGVHLENKAGDFKNDYRFMTADVVNDILKTVRTLRAIKWHVDFTPSVLSIQKLRFQAGANSDETKFIAKTEGTDLKFFFGDHSSHAGDFVFQADITGKISKGWSWPVSSVMGILSLPGDKTYKISDEGASMITVDSGIAMYEYTLPAQTK